MSLAAFLASLAAAGLLLTTVQVFLVWRARRPFARRPAAASPPGASSPRTARRVSILKPLSGLDDGLEENLASFARLTGVEHEVILSAERGDDPAVDAARAVMARLPDAPFRLVVGGAARRPLENGKVDRLVAAARHATGDVLLVSDSNVRVAPGDVAATAALFDDPSVGCVSNLFVAQGAETFGARVEALHLLSFVVPGAALAAAGGFPCVVGKSMAVSRRALEAIGGFGAFLGVLAEDQAIGLAVRAAGFRVVLSGVVVRNVVERRTLARALDRQVRWGKIRYAFSRTAYTAELLLNPFPLALLAAAAALLLSPDLLQGCGALAGAVGLARVAQASVLARATGSDLPAPSFAAVLVKDVLQLATHLVPYVSDEVAWHGLRARVGPGTALLPAGRHVPSLEMAPEGPLAPLTPPPAAPSPA